MVRWAGALALSRSKNSSGSGLLSLIRVLVVNRRLMLGLSKLILTMTVVGKCLITEE